LEGLRVAFEPIYILLMKGCQYVHCGLPPFHSGKIIQNARAKIVDALLTLILGHGYDLLLGIFAYKGSR